MANKCTGCAHWRSSSGDKCCNYILDTGHRRGCSPDRCDKYTAAAQPQEHEIIINTLSPEAAERKKADEEFEGYQARQAKLNRRYGNER